MKKSLILALCVILIGKAFSQNYDLLVTTDGDSIACHIDSIANNTVYFKMKASKYWVHTSAEQSRVAELKYDAIDKELYVFKKGSSIIETDKEQRLPTNVPINSIRHNAVFFGVTFVALTINYEHLFPIKDNIGFSTRAGTGFDFINMNFLIIGEGNFLVGGPNNFLELGAGYQYQYQTSGFLMFKLGYRFQHDKGFLFKISPMYFYNLEKNGDWKHFGGISFGFGSCF